MNMYNAAVTDLNNINVIFNDFVEFRNNRFLPQKPDMEIKAMLTPIDSLLSAAYQKLEELDESPANFQYNSSLLRNRLATLSNRIAEQKVFLKRYLASALPERNQLFYEPVH